MYKFTKASSRSGASRTSRQSRVPTAIEGFFVGRALKSQEPVDEIVHEINHHFALGALKNRSQIVHCNAGPSCRVDEKEREARSHLIEDAADAFFEGSLECRG